MELAHEANAPNKAGMAALTLIEEIDTLKPEVLAAAYEQANEWLVNCYNQGLLLRFKTAGMKWLESYGIRQRMRTRKICFLID